MDENQTSVHVSVDAPTPSTDNTNDALMLALTAMGVRLDSIQAELASVHEFMARIEVDEAEETEALEDVEETVEELVESDAEVHNELESEQSTDEAEARETTEATSESDEFIPPETVREFDESESSSESDEDEQSPRAEHWWWRRIG